MVILEVEHLKKTYTTRLGSNRVEALRDVNFNVEQGEFVAIMGESGSGKTTLLNLLAALDKPTGGQIRLNGKNLGDLKEKEIAAFRRENLGFVFQDFNLLDTYLKFLSSSAESSSSSDPRSSPSHPQYLQHLLLPADV